MRGSGEVITITRAITYTYDPLNRLTGAAYSTGQSFEYAYDAVGNRTAMTSVPPLSGTVVTTYTFDAANRLTDRAVSDGRVYSYTWSARGQMLAEYTQGYPVRTFTYDGAGRMVAATLFTQTTKFAYNGLGARVAVEVVGQGTTTYTLDYAAGDRILAEQTADGMTLYLYGRDCLGELRDGDWLYYLNDGTGLVRQGVDEQGQVVSGWLFDPDGAVLEGPEGPVSHLVCGGVYDWSTGLIYKGGRYFDPLLGIWLALVPLVMVQSWRGRKKRRRGFPWIWLLLLGVCIGGTLTACGGDGGTTTVSPEYLRDLCVDVPASSEFQLTATLHAPSPVVRKGPWPARGDTWQARLGDFDPTAETAGAHILGQVVPPDGTVGEVKFEQQVRFRQTYHFEDRTIEYLADNTTWYLDGQSPLSGKYTGPTPCEGGSGICGFFDDSPGAALELGNVATRSPLIEFERDETFNTYLLWYPVPSCRVPLAVVEWHWKVTAKAKRNVDAFPGTYPYVWSSVGFETTPALNVETQGNPVEADDKIYGPLPPAPPTDYDIAAWW